MPEGRDAHLVRVTVLAVIGLVVALCLPSAGRDSAGEAPGVPTGVSVVSGQGVGDGP
ncbi:hypothetical protein ACFQ6E_25110 [Streptomyces sp. NPDC056462]|uniref:hypothetical protein n=1 Tax=Streptomyces sp. NPDC056462 TaxID=3345826 RepID=UPI0036AB4066